MLTLRGKCENLPRKGRIAIAILFSTIIVPRLQIVTHRSWTRGRAQRRPARGQSSARVRVLADGMGGQAVASLAAELAVKTVSVEVARAAEPREVAAVHENYAVAMAIREGATMPTA